MVYTEAGTSDNPRLLSTSTPVSTASSTACETALEEGMWPISPTAPAVPSESRDWWKASPLLSTSATAFLFEATEPRRLETKPGKGDKGRVTGPRYR